MRVEITTTGLINSKGKMNLWEDMIRITATHSTMFNQSNRRSNTNNRINSIQIRET
jgi:hypothetical protein